MYELVQVAPCTYYIECPAKIGVYTPDPHTAILIDSGNDKDAARKVLKILADHHWSLAAIVNTHSHADHIGGNKYLQTQTGCKVFASGIELAFTRHPLLEPAFLYGGFPGKDLRHKFLLAQESEALPFTDAAYPSALEPIPLPGHSWDMVGFRTPDDVVFLADCLSSKATLEKYSVPFLLDVRAYLDTLAMVMNMQASLFIPAHAPAAASIAPLAAYNREKMLEVSQTLLTLCHTPMIFEDILAAVFAHYSLTMTIEQYVLVGSTVRSFLAWLKDEGKVAFSFQQSKMLWQTVP